MAMTNNDPPEDMAQDVISEKEGPLKSQRALIIEKAQNQLMENTVPTLPNTQTRRSKYLRNK